MAIHITQSEIPPSEAIHALAQHGAKQPLATQHLGLPVMEVAGVQLALETTALEQIAGETLGAVSAPTAINPICVTLHEHITYTPPMVLHGGVCVLRLTLLMHLK